MLAYLIIVSIAVAGMMQAHWWAAIAGGCVLALLTIVEQRAVTIPSSLPEHSSTALSLMNGSVAAVVAFAAGRASGWIWGI